MGKKVKIRKGNKTDLTKYKILLHPYYSIYFHFLDHLITNCLSLDASFWGFFLKNKTIIQFFFFPCRSKAARWICSSQHSRLPGAILLL